MNTRTSLTIGLPVFLLLLGGCIIVDSTPTDGTAGSGGRDTTASSTSSSSSGGSAGAGGMGGAGGQAGAGVGGTGGGCVGPEDGVLDALTCDTLNTQTTGNVCGAGGNDKPLSIGTCVHGFDIFQRGAYDVLAKCLKTIPGDATSACNNALVSECIAEMYKAACPSQDAATTCQAIATQGCNPGDVFDTQTCLIDTNPLNADGLTQLVEYMNEPNVDPNCNTAYLDALDRVLAIPQMP